MVARVSHDYQDVSRAVGGGVSRILGGGRQGETVADDVEDEAMEAAGEDVQDGVEDEQRRPHRRRSGRC